MEKSTVLMTWIGLSMISVAYVTNAQGSDETDRKYRNPMFASLSQLPLERQREIMESYVKPYQEKIEVWSITEDSQTDRPMFLKVWIIADDGNSYKVYYDNLTATFGLAKYTPGRTPYMINASNDLKNIFLPYK